MDRSTSLYACATIISLFPLLIAQHVGADEMATGAEFVFPDVQRSTLHFEPEIKQAIARLKKSGTKADLSEAAQIEEKFTTAQRVMKGKIGQSDNLELHVIGLYEGKASPEIDGRGAKVRVTMTHAPLILCLTAYEPVTWMLEVDDRVDLRQVILGGQKGSVVGLPDDVPIADYSRPRETGKQISYAYAKNDEDSGSQAYDRLCNGLEEITGIRPSSFDGSYNPKKTFVVGPDSDVWCEEQSYALMRDARLFATRSKRNAIWQELMSLRFPATSQEGGDPFHGHGGKQFYGTHSVLGPIKGMQKQVENQLNRRREMDTEIQLTRPNGDVDVIRWDDSSHLPKPQGISIQAFDSKRKRWVMVGPTESGALMFAYSIPEKKWSALRSMTGINLQSGLTYSEEHDRFFALGSGMVMHTGRDYPIIYTLHPNGAALSRIPLDKLPPGGGPGHRHFIQTELNVVGDYFLMRETARNHREPDNPSSVSTKVIHQETGELIADVPGFAVTTVEEQQQQVAELLQARQNNATGHLASIPKVKTPSKPKRKPGEVRQAIAALESPFNGHSYEIVTRAGDMTWKQAMKFAANSVHQGARGHLVTITSKEENDFLIANFAAAGDTWAGGSDADREGVWEWMCGPEIGNVFYEVNGNDNGYHNWGGRGDNIGRGHFVEPNNSSGEEHYLHWNWQVGAPRNRDSSGSWNDWDADRTCSYIIVEYSTTPAANKFHRSQSQTKQPTRNSKTAAKPDFKPADAVATYLSWNDGWQVHGYSLDENAWATWSSPNCSVARGSKLAVGDKYIAVVSPDIDSMGWLLDRRTAKWSKLPSDGEFQQPRRGGDLVVGGEVVRGRVRLSAVDFAHFVGDALFVSSANRGNVKSRIFDTNTHAWRAAAESPLSGRQRSLNGASDNHVFVFGGYPNFLQDGAVYNVEKNQWMHMPEPPVKFKYGTDGHATNGNFVIFGGQEQREAAVFNVKRGEWISLEDIPFDTAMSGVAAVNNSLFVWSGYDAAEQHAGVCNLNTKKWRRINKGPLEPRCLTHTSVVDGKIIFFGGWDPHSESFLQDGAIYDPQVDTWTAIPNLPGRVPMALHPGW